MKTRTPSQFTIGTVDQENGKTVILPQSAEPSHLKLILSEAEKKELANYETVIENHWQTFLEVGCALARIRDQKLYRANNDTFEEYCLAKWHYARSHAYRLIGAAEMVKLLSPIGDIPAPTHEAQVRPLIGLRPEQALLAWKAAAGKAKGAMITAKLVKEAIAQALGDQLVESPKLKMKSGKTANREIPLVNALELLERLEDSIRKKTGIKPLLMLLTQLRACLKSFGKRPKSVL